MESTRVIVIYVKYQLILRHAINDALLENR
jgi:hypothetical protein